MDIDFDATTALLVIDVQNDFAHPDGNLYVEGGDAIVPTINELVRQAERAEAPVVFTQDWHPEETPHFQAFGGDWPVHCVQDTWGAELHADLVVPEGAEIVRKGTGGEDGYSGFTVRDPESGEEDPTELDRILTERGVERVVVVGLAQDVCVHATVLDAREAGYETIVLTDATRPVEMEPGDGDRALEDMREAGADVR
jgi:nicotinamidase/pyrazinamidase